VSGPLDNTPSVSVEPPPGVLSVQDRAAGPTEHRSSRPWVAPLATGAAVAGGCAAIALLQPSDGDTPLCWSRAIFGFDCPFCGGMRCVASLMRGDWLDAADHNVVAALILPVVAVAWAVWMIRALRGDRMRSWRPRAIVVVAALVALVGFSVVRNLDVAPWTTWLAASAS